MFLGVSCDFLLALTAGFHQFAHFPINSVDFLQVLYFSQAKKHTGRGQTETLNLPLGVNKSVNDGILDL